jgi:hypothetical protein
MFKPGGKLAEDIVIMLIDYLTWAIRVCEDQRRECVSMMRTLMAEVKGGDWFGA